MPNFTVLKVKFPIYLDVDDPHEFSEMESVFVELDNKLIPFFIDSIQVKTKNFATVRFNGINSEKKAKHILKAKLYLPLDLLPELDESEFYHFEIEGYTVIDNNFGDIGTLSKVLDFKTNPLLEIIAKNGTEILLPKQDQFIQSVDREKEILYVNAPKELLSMYLEEE